MMMYWNHFKRNKAAYLRSWKFEINVERVYYLNSRNMFQSAALISTFAEPSHYPSTRPRKVPPLIPPLPRLLPSH